MKIEITGLDDMTTWNHTPVYLLNGVTEGGVRCIVAVNCIVLRTKKDLRKFQRELLQVIPESASVLASNVPVTDIITGVAKK